MDVLDNLEICIRNMSLLYKVSLDGKYVERTDRIDQQLLDDFNSCDSGI